MSDAEQKAAVSRFLKTVNATAQREIEKVVRNAVASGKIKGNEALTTSVTLSNAKLGLDLTIFSKIEL